MPYSNARYTFSTSNEQPREARCHGSGSICLLCVPRGAVILVWRIVSGESQWLPLNTAECGTKSCVARWKFFARYCDQLCLVKKNFCVACGLILLTIWFTFFDVSIATVPRYICSRLPDLCVHFSWIRYRTAEKDILYFDWIYLRYLLPAERSSFLAPLFSFQFLSWFKTKKRSHFSLFNSSGSGFYLDFRIL